MTAVRAARSFRNIVCVLLLVFERRAPIRPYERTDNWENCRRVSPRQFTSVPRPFCFPKISTGVVCYGRLFPSYPRLISVLNDKTLSNYFASRTQITPCGRRVSRCSSLGLRAASSQLLVSCLCAAAQANCAPVFFLMASWTSRRTSVVH